MKNTFNHIIVLFVLILSACAPPLVFDKPFPPNEDNLITIPEKFQGTFMCESDSTLVVISDHVIYAREPYYFEEKIEDIEAYEDCRFVGDKLIMNATGEEVPVEILENGKVKGFFIEQDTIFEFHDESIARPYDGHLLLSISMEDGQWAIYGLTKDGSGNIIYRAINEATDLELADEITPLTEIERESEEDPPRYLARPTLAEFDRMFRNERIYIECEKLIKIKVDQLNPNIF